MIWTNNRQQIPYGSKVAQTTIAGTTWNVWSGNNNHYIAFVPADGKPILSASYDLKDFFNYLVTSSRMPATSTLAQVDYGVEVVSTDGSPATFTFTGFTVNAS